VLIGISKVNITPKDHQSILRGKKGDISQGNAILDDLYVRTICLFQNRKILIINVDLLWVSKELTEAIRNWAHEKFEIHPDYILISATHTHHSPQIKKNIFDGNTVNGAYVSYLEEKIKQSISEALNSYRPGYLEYSYGYIKGTVNRRKYQYDLPLLLKGKFRKQVLYRPNYRGVNDNKFIALWIYSSDDDLLGVILNFSCHPTTYGGQAITADFPGQIAALLSEQFSRSFVTFYIQGFAGNIRPNLIRRTELTKRKIHQYLYYRMFPTLFFYKTENPADITHFARNIVSDILETFNQKEKLKPSFFADVGAIPLKCERKKSRQYFENLRKANDAAISSYASYVIGNYHAVYDVRLNIQRINFAENIILVAMDGEIFTQYALWLRATYEKSKVHIMPVGCANGMVGYIPDAESLNQGGYEPERSITLFGIPEKFSRSIEAQIKNGISTILEDSAVPVS